MFNIIILKIKICSFISIIIMSANFNQNKFSWNWTRIFFSGIYTNRYNSFKHSLKNGEKICIPLPDGNNRKKLNVVQTIL